jgi:hypothetical protein
MTPVLEALVRPRFRETMWSGVALVLALVPLSAASGEKIAGCVIYSGQTLGECRAQPTTVPRTVSNGTAAIVPSKCSAPPLHRSSASTRCVQIIESLRQKSGN